MPRGSKSCMKQPASATTSSAACTRSSAQFPDSRSSPPSSAEGSSTFGCRPKDIPIATGAKRTGRRLLTVGTDCAVGKKYTALALERELRARGPQSDVPRDRSDRHHDCGHRHSDRRRRERLRRWRGRDALPCQRCRSLGHRRRTRLAVSPELRRCDARPDSWLAARRAGAMSRPVTPHDRLHRRLSDPAASARASRGMSKQRN